MRPRVNFCWLCGRKLWGNKHIETFVDGHIRILHKACHERIEREESTHQETPLKPLAANCRMEVLNEMYPR